MNVIRSWALGLSCAAIIGVIVSSLSPSGGIEKSIKTVIALFVMSMMILPLCKGIGAFSVDDYSIDYSRNEVENALTDTVTNQIKKAEEQEIKELLKTNGINCISVSINIEIKDEIIKVKTAEVLISSPETDKAKELIKDKLGIEANVRRE